MRQPRPSGRRRHRPRRRPSGHLLALVGLWAAACSVPADVPAPITIRRQAASTAPYPASTVFTGLSWDYGTHLQLAPGSDIWAATWGPGGDIWAYWGDGGGFGGSNTDHRVSVGLARIAQNPPGVSGTNVWGNATSPATGGWAPNQATFCGKPDSVFSIGGTVYAFMSSYYNATSNDVPTCPSPNPSPTEVWLTWTSDDGQTVQQSSWRIAESTGTLVPEFFVQFGQDGAGEPAALGSEVYLYAVKAGDPNDVFLVRSTVANLQDYTQYQVFSGLDGSGAPTWTSAWNPSQASPVFTDPNGATNFAAVYHPATRRFLANAFHGVDDNGDVGEVQDLGVFDAPAPWGPWTTVYYTDSWGPAATPFGNGEPELLSMPQKWMSSDGTHFWAVFSSEHPASSTVPGDALNLMEATLTFVPAGSPDAGAGTSSGTTSGSSSSGSGSSGSSSSGSGGTSSSAATSGSGSSGTGRTSGGAATTSGSKAAPAVSGGCGCDAGAGDSGLSWLVLAAALLFTWRRTPL